MKRAIYMPAYQAEQYLEETVERIPADLMRNLDVLWILNDGSTDRTAEIADQLAIRYPQIVHCSFPINRGYGAMVQEAWTKAQNQGIEQLICLHADGQYAPEKIPEMLAKLSQGNHVLQGSRHLGSPLAGGMPLYKWMGGKALTFLENRVFGLTLSDYHSGFLAFDREAIVNLHVQGLSGNFDIDLEIIAMARYRGLSIAEIPIPTRYAHEVSYLSPISYGLRVLGVLSKYLRGKYA